MADNVISLMPKQDALINPALGYICERVQVFFDIEHGDVYSPSSQYINGRWQKVYRLSKQGLNKLLNAGGIETISQSVTQRGSEWIWDAQWSGKYTTPAGIVIPLVDDYTFDVTIGGPRWIKRKEDEIDRTIASQIKSGDRYPSPDQIAQARMSMDNETLKPIEERAENVATRFCVEAAQFGAQRAASGARNRALRVYFQLRGFTEDEIRHSYFEIYRTRVDPEAMRESLGETGARLFAFTQLLRNSGMEDPNELASMTKVLLEAELKKEEIAAKAVAHVVEDDPYDIPITRETLGAIRRNVVDLFPSFAPLSDRVLIPNLGRFLGQEWDQTVRARDVMTEGVGLSILAFYEKMKEEGADNPDKDAWRESALWCVENRMVWDGIVVEEEPEPETEDDPETIEEE